MAGAEGSLCAVARAAGPHPAGSAAVCAQCFQVYLWQQDCNSGDAGTAKKGIAQLQDRGFNSAEEMQQYDSSSRYELEREITAENLTEHNPLRIPVERYAARNGISLDEAMHILRETRYDESAAG